MSDKTYTDAVNEVVDVAMAVGASEEFILDLENSLKDARETLEMERAQLVAARLELAKVTGML